MFVKTTVSLAIFFVFVSSIPNSPEVDFSPDDVKKGLINEGVSESGATEITVFLFKDRPEDITAGELKTEFREFLEKMSIEDKSAIKGIISRELEKFFSESGDNQSIFLVG
ncbi:hypothetical protein GCK72_018040 [Caenorhabditis remanei]|nr:hypothetical protein GCK72_018040 [Caenorhabditis remanei]KAF1751486.1 hypothetical protein GCK72_018040 [Caenorhabditis remanei]